MRRLVLFDVDGTLIERGDPDHLAAIDHGIHTVFPETHDASIRQIDFDGKVDRVIAVEVLAHAGVRVGFDDSRLERVFDLLNDYYRKQWASRSGGQGDLLPGVRELITELRKRDDEFALGVLTGGSRGVVEVKMDRLGLSEYFPVGAFGSEVDNRPALVPLALERAAVHYRETFDPERCVIVGDTPHDIHCAHQSGVPCLAVATGKYSEDELRAAGADEMVPSLMDTTRTVRTLLTLSFDPR